MIDEKKLQIYFAWKHQYICEFSILNVTYFANQQNYLFTFKLSNDKICPIYVEI